MTVDAMNPADSDRWPAIAVADWQDTRDTLQLYTQIVGKVRLANEPRINHWWNVALYLTARGLTTTLMPHPTGPAFQIDFDFVDHLLEIHTVTGATRSIDLRPRPVADFYAEVMNLLDELHVGTEIWPMPVEIPDFIPFPEDHVHASYDPEAVHRFWRALVEMERVLKVFRSRFVGKSSPVHLFWGALDLASTRFSGRTAPPHPGGAPNCGPHVMWEAYSHEVSSAGYWPGPPGEEGIFYSYAYPDPPGYRDTSLGIDGARWTTSSASSSSPTSSSAPQPIPTPCCSSSCNAPTRRPPPPQHGTATRSNDPTEIPPAADSVRIRAL